MSGDLYLSECFMSDGGVLLPALHEGSSLFDFWQQWRRQKLPTEHKLSSQDVTLLTLSRVSLLSFWVFSENQLLFKGFSINWRLVIECSRQPLSAAAAAAGIPDMQGTTY